MIKTYPSKPTIKTGGILLSIGAAFVLIALLLVLIEWQNFRYRQFLLPKGSHWGTVDVSSLSIEQAEQRIENIFNTPVELRYRDQRIQTGVETLGFSLDLSAGKSRWKEFTRQATFWDYLWQSEVLPVSLDLVINYDEGAASRFLREQVAARYDNPPETRIPLAGTTRFTNSKEGYFLDLAASLDIIAELQPLSESRSVDLVIKDDHSAQVDTQLLQAVLKQYIQQVGFNGVAEIYIQNLVDSQTLHFALRGGEEIAPEIAFSAASTIKIPILLSALLRTSQPIPDDFKLMAERMMILSENPPADALMEQVIGSTLAPLQVSEDLQKLGFANTFLAGYFYLGAPLLQRFDTPANTRGDVDLRPDVYNQTTAGEMGRLLVEIYRCAKDSSGLLFETFGDKMSAEKCQLILDLMQRNKIGVLIEAGVPEGTPVAHKHGWTEEADGYLHTISDAGIIFAPQADYVQVIFLYDPLQLLFDPGNALMAQLSQVVFNAFNPDHQLDWGFGQIRYR